MVNARTVIGVRQRVISGSGGVGAPGERVDAVGKDVGLGVVVQRRRQSAAKDGEVARTVVRLRSRKVVESVRIRAALHEELAHVSVMGRGRVVIIGCIRVEAPCCQPPPRLVIEAAPVSIGAVGRDVERRLAVVVPVRRIRAARIPARAIAHRVNFLVAFALRIRAAWEEWRAETRVEVRRSVIVAARRVRAAREEA